MRINKIVAISLLLSLSACDTATETQTADVKPEESSAPSEVIEVAEVTGTLDKTNEMAKISYAMGANSGLFLARNLPEFEKWGMTIDPELIKEGFIESLGNKSQMTEEDIQAVLIAFQEQIKAKLAEVDEKQAVVTAEANKLILEANAAKEGVKTTESGLQYRMITEGTGASPKATDTVKVHYRGTLVTGEEFDSSYSRNEPTQFPLNGVIAGWTEGLQLVKEGGKIELVIPPALAYGDRELPTIPANSVLIFEVELLEIVKVVGTEKEEK